MRAQLPAPVRDQRDSSPNRHFFLLFWCIGILAGLFARDFIETAGEAVGPARPVAAANETADEAGPASTFVVNVNAVLSLPSATPTGTAAPRPTSTPERSPQLDFCGAVPAQEGAVCRMPAATATATPTLPACFSPQAEDGKLCQIRSTPTPAPEPNEPRMASGS